jgi:hypothetical protein
MDVIKGSSFAIGGTVYTVWTGDASTSTIATPVQMTGATVKLFVKQRETDSDANAILNISGTVVSTSLATVQASVTAAQTNDLSYQNLVFELVTKLSDGTFHRSGVDAFNLKPNVCKTLF